MRIEIHGSGVEATAGLRRHIEEKAETVLQRFQDEIETVTVTLEDTNGPRGGVDQQCRVAVKLYSQPRPGISTSVHENIGGAIKLSFDKAVFAVSRMLDKRQRQSRRIVTPV